MKTDFFNEAIVTAMLAASVQSGEQSEPEGEELLQPDLLRERLVLLLDRADKAAVQAGLPPDLVDTADFAVCAFIDETILSSASWSGRMDWLKKPLQFLRHGTATAGEDFYRLLNALLEQARGKAPITTLSGSRKTDVSTSGEEDPLSAVLEIFALCLAQGFTGMHYSNPRAIDEQLDRIGRFVPAVNRHATPFFVSPEEKNVKRKPRLRRAADLIRRFDLLDWALWILPPALTLLLYSACKSQLDQLLQSFLQGVQ